MKDSSAESRAATSRMVWFDAEIGEQQLLAARVLAAAARFCGHKHCVNICQCFWIVGFQDPAFLAYIVFIEDAQAARLTPVRPFSTPGLKRPRVLNARLCIQIERIEN